MSNVAVYNLKGEKTGTAKLPDEIFSLPENAELVWQVLESERSNLRKGTAHAKDRSAVSGGGKKPWRQKGTGWARHGSIRSPIWRGGGVTHGPLKEKSYYKKVNKKMKNKAFFVALSQKMRDGEIFIFDKINFETGRTKDASLFFKDISKLDEFKKLEKKKSVIISLAKPDPFTARALKNIPGAKINEARNISLLEILSSRYIFLPKESIKVLQSRRIKTSS